jgi:ferredoxin
MHLARCPESYSNAKQKIRSALSDDVQKSCAGGTITSYCGTAVEGSYDEVEDPGDPLDYSSPAAQNDATVKLLLSG